MSALTKVVHPQCKTLQFQQRTNWCWAASAVNVEICKSLNITQCTVAGKCLPICGTDCSDENCNVPYFLHEALSTQGSYKGWTQGRITPGKVKKELDGNRPIGVRIQWSGSMDGHFILIVGYGFKKTDRKKMFYLIFDPHVSSGFSALPSSSMERECGYRATGTWTETLFTK